MSLSAVITVALSLPRSFSTLKRIFDRFSTALTRRESERSQLKEAETSAETVYGEKRKKGFTGSNLKLIRKNRNF